jgi:hypothetical protein
MYQLGKAKRLALLAVLAAVPLAANATAITYDFTGTVTSTTGIYADAGPTVTGMPMAGPSLERPCRAPWS